MSELSSGLCLPQIRPCTAASPYRLNPVTEFAVQADSVECNPDLQTSHRIVCLALGKGQGMRLRGLLLLPIAPKALACTHSE
eukprot:5742751-Amphidinium_carterae.1